MCDKLERGKDVVGSSNIVIESSHSGCGTINEMETETTELIELPDYFVGVQQEYLISRSTESARRGNCDGNHPKDSTDPPKGKKRARDEKYAPEDRLCLQIQRGNVCPFGDQCHYRYDLHQMNIETMKL